MSTKRIPAAERRRQFMKYVNEGKVDEGYYVIDKGNGVQIRRCKQKTYNDASVQTDRVNDTIDETVTHSA